MSTESFTKELVFNTEEEIDKLIDVLDKNKKVNIANIKDVKILKDKDEISNLINKTKEI